MKWGIYKVVTNQRNVSPAIRRKPQITLQNWATFYFVTAELPQVQFPVSFHLSKRLRFLLLFSPPLSLPPTLQNFELNIAVTPQSLNRVCAAVIRSKCLSQVVRGLTLIQVLPGSLRDPVAQAAVSDHFQLGLHFAPHVP